MSAEARRSPGLFLATCAAATGLALLAWRVASTYYLAAVVWVANVTLGALGAGVSIRPPTGASEAAYPVVAGAIALFVATPGHGLAWKARWLIGLLGGLFLLHIGLVCLDAHAAAVARTDLHAGSGTTLMAGLADMARANLGLGLVALTWIMARPWTTHAPVDGG